MSATEVLTAANAVPFLGQPETQEATMPELRLYLDSESQGAAVDGVDATDEELAGSGDVGGARRADAQAPKVADQRIVEAGVKEQAMACTRRDEATSEGEQPQSPPAASLPGKGETVSEASPGQSSPEALGTGHDASAQQVPDSQRKNKSIFSTDDLSDSDVELDLGYTSSPPAAASKKAFSRLKKRNTSPREDCSRPDALDGLIDKSPPVHHRRNRALVISREPLYVGLLGGDKGQKIHSISQGFRCDSDASATSAGFAVSCQAIDSDAEEDHDVVHGRLSKGGQSEEEDGEGREDDDNEDSGAQHPGDENSVDLEELNRRTQAALRGPVPLLCTFSPR